MKRAVLAATLLAASSSAAFAGTYVGLGIGSNAVYEGSDRLKKDGRSARLTVGYTFRPMKRNTTFSLEGALGGYGLGLKDRTSIVEIDAYQLSAAGKLNVPLADHFEAFGRLGLQYTTASAANPIYDTEGTGFLVGAGIEYRFTPGIGRGASLTLDYQLNKVTLSGERFQGASAFNILERQWTLGATISF
jgi:opacity protein-like surface antigen